MSDLYLECISGISGDMTVASLLDLGASREVLQQVLDTIPAKGFKTEITRVSKNAIDVCDFNVILDEDNHDHDMEYLHGHNESHDECEHTHDDGEHNHSEHKHIHHHEHRSLKDVYDIIDKTTMTDKARALAKKIFLIVAQAEAKVHNKAIEQVHFHEVGALDSIVDIISIAVCFDNLCINKVYVPHLYEGTGTVRCQHGLLPIPVPAVAAICSDYNLPLSLTEDKGEFVTPTGAAFIAAVMTDNKMPKSFAIKKIGMGGGKRSYDRPSILRAFLIENTDESADTIYRLESNIDDCSGEALGFVMDLLMEKGALDVHYIPCFMKKNRPAYVLNVICKKQDIQKLEEVIFINTSTIGIRRVEMERTKLKRTINCLDTEYGQVEVKTVEYQGLIKNYPEYESVAKLCKANGLSFWELYNKVKALADNSF